MREGIFIIILCLPLLVSSSSSFPCHPDQRDALLRFIHPFSVTSSSSRYCPIDPYPHEVSSWREGKDCCSWDGVTCDNSTGDVVGLDLTCAGLLGSIHSGSPLFSLRRLRTLSLSQNDLLGSTIPPDIGVLSQLEDLDFSYSNISGMLPMEISQLSKLSSLFLSDYSGLVVQDHTIKMLVSNMTRIEELHLGSVNMSTVTPTSFMNLSSSLISLQLYGCSLEGQFPEFLFGLPNLRDIDLTGNEHLAITLPESDWSPRLDSLFLSDCSLTGTIPKSLGNLLRLTFLDLSRNSYTGGGLDLGILSTLEDLTYLDLSGISVYGEDANHRFSLPKLQHLSMENCNLSEVPSFLSRSEGLGYLHLSGNKIQEIPTWLWSSDTLSYLSLHGNNIEGSIPPSICQLTSLGFVDLSQNDLVGVIPPCLGNLTGLELLLLGENSLSGPLTPSLTNSTSLRQINVSYNNLVDRLPVDIFSQSAWLLYIDLSENNFEGQPPIPPVSTVFYWAFNNRFSGEISSLICNSPSLVGLDLSNNSLTGTLPDCLGALMDLQFLSLRENKFDGQIPESFPEASKLMSLDLSRNRFEGPLPRSLSNCRALEFLDVGGNKITDSFPDWLGDLPLKVLSLRSNNFHGRVIIANETRKFSRVRILDLSNNFFEGDIMDSFIAGLFGVTSYEYMSQYLGPHNSVWEYYSATIDLKGVETDVTKINLQFAMLDLSNNYFQGQIPSSIGSLKSLMGLNFSHNRLTGKIPPSLGKLTYLEALDLSSNYLTGDIPKEMEKLSFLGFLDLSWNNLTGAIPTGGHFNTFPNSSFQGNLGLCGNPLTVTCRRGNEEARGPPKGKDGGGGWWLGWKCVVWGFGAGVGMGISLGYTVLEMGRPLWLVRMVIRVEVVYKKASKRKWGWRKNV